MNQMNCIDKNKELNILKLKVKELRLLQNYMFVKYLIFSLFT